MPHTLEQLFPCRQLAGLGAELEALSDPDAAPALARRLADFVQTIAASGLDGLAVSRILSTLNDRLTARIIALTARQHRLPPAGWCWLALGSEGRLEQTLLTDQDNGLIFNATDSREADSLRALFQPFAAAVNQHLAAAGFTLCNGGIMAGNPAWCLSLDEWREHFIEWVRRPDPTALLNASIFFDFRPLCGEAGLAEQLRGLLLSLTVDTPAFLHLMAANALQAHVPLGFLGEVVAADGEAGNEIDLKKFGSRIFVDAARIFALASGVRSVSTAERLQAGGLASGLQADEITAMTAAFSHILRLRLNQQLLDRAAGKRLGCGLKPTLLNDVDRAILRESLKQARRLQLRLKLNYAL